MCIGSFGTWRGISYSCMRRLNHQIALDLSGTSDRITAHFETPAYRGVLLEHGQITAHVNEFTNSSQPFDF